VIKERHRKNQAAAAEQKPLLKKDKLEKPQLPSNI